MHTLLKLQQARALQQSVTLSHEQASEVLAVLGNLGDTVNQAVEIFKGIGHAPEVLPHLPPETRAEIAAFLETILARKQRAKAEIQAAEEILECQCGSSDFVPSQGDPQQLMCSQCGMPPEIGANVRLVPKPLKH